MPARTFWWGVLAALAWIATSNPGVEPPRSARLHTRGSSQLTVDSRIPSLQQPALDAADILAPVQISQEFDSSAPELQLVELPPAPGQLINGQMALTAVQRYEQLSDFWPDLDPAPASGTASDPSRGAGPSAIDGLEKEPAGASSKGWKSAF